MKKSLDELPFPYNSVRNTVPNAHWFPELEGPDLSKEIVPGQHAALKLLDTHTISEIFSEGFDQDDSDANS